MGGLQSGDHVPHTLVAGVGGTQPHRQASGSPRVARAGLQVQRPELVDTDHRTLGGRVVVEVQDPAHLRGEVRVGASLPRLGGLPRHPTLVQDPPDGLDADRRDVASLNQAWNLRLLKAWITLRT